MRRLQAADGLRVEDPYVAARHFIALVTAVDDGVEAGVRAFLHGYSSG
jgi:hypothetical protein